MNKPKRYTITAALPYANGPLHIGHIAGAYLPSDIYARFKRLQGNDVAFICGTDEHGAAITIRAKQENASPKAIVDKYHAQMAESFKKLGISFDIFHRTSAQLHHDTAQEFFLDLYNKGFFEKKETLQFYDTDYDQFLADRYIKGICPKCKHNDAYGDQCESCGSTLSPTELIDPKSTLSGKTPERRKTFHWYLPLDKDEAWLKTWINEGILDGKKHHDPSSWKKNVMGQVNSWLNDGLQPRAITRDLTWGVSVPKEVPGHENKKLYVWLDAPIGYISATKQLALDGVITDWKPYWQDENTELIHFIGKDNIVFHTIIFPSILKAKGNYILPVNVPGNEFMNLEGNKISTSRNWAIWVHEIVEDFPHLIDAFRYVISANIPETKDAEFTWNDFQTRVNSELVAALGNFVNRVLVLNKKYYANTLPHVELRPEINLALENVLAHVKEDIEEKLDAFKFRDALEVMMKLARDANKFLTDYEPWKLIKTDEKATEEVLYACTQIVANLALLMQVFMPESAKKIWNSLAINEVPKWNRIGATDLIAGGHKLGENQLLFEKIDDDFVAQQIEKLQASKVQERTYAPLKSEIQFDDFTQLDIRVGTITAAEKIKKADRLLKLSVDLGFETRTIVSGIAQHFSPEEVIGEKVQVLVNLAPRKMRGVESQGMILFSENSDGTLLFVSPLADAENGTQVS